LLGDFATSNRRLLDRIVLLDFEKPFDLIPEYKRVYENQNRVEARLKRLSSSSKKSQSFIWSQLLNAARTYFEEPLTRT